MRAAGLRRPAALARRRAAPLLVLLLAGCAGVPDVAPPVELPQAFSRTGDGGAPAERWWETLDDPVLDALVEEALARNLSLRVAWDRLAQARAIARREGAELWPSLDLDSGATLTWSRQPDGGFSATGTRRDDFFDVGGLLSYEIDLWGRVRATRDAARFDAFATDAELRATAVSLSSLLASTWYALVERQGQLDLLDEQIATNEQVLQLVGLRFRMGQVSAADVLRQRQLVEQRRGEQALVRADLEVLAHALAVLLGRPPAAAGLPVPAGLAALPELPDTGLPVELIARRPDVQRAYLEVLAADRRLHAARADRLPSLRLTGSAALGADELRDVVDNWIATLAANLVAPLVDGGRRRAEVARTRAVVSERVHLYGEAILTALQEVEDALVQEQQLRLYLESLERQLVLAQQALERIRDRYTKGAVDYLDVLDALATQQELARTRLAAQRELVDQRIELHRALAGGFGLEEPEPATPSPGRS